MAQTILVTGGAGFIGSHVCEALLARGDRIVALDNFNDFYDPAIKRRNWAEVLRSGGSRALLATGDIRDAGLVERLFAEHAFDGVVHLAAMAGVRPSLRDPLHYEDVNIRGTLTLLEEVRRRRGLRFVYASSSSVYGDHDRSPGREPRTTSSRPRGAPAGPASSSCFDPSSLQRRFSPSPAPSLPRPSTPSGASTRTPGR